MRVRKIIDEIRSCRGVGFRVTNLQIAIKTNDGYDRNMFLGQKVTVAVGYSLGYIIHNRYDGTSCLSSCGALHRGIKFKKKADKLVIKMAGTP